MVAKMQANAKVVLNLQKKNQNAIVLHRKFVDFSRVKINDLQLEHYCVITSMSMHMCAYKLIPSLKRQFIFYCPQILTTVSENLFFLYHRHTHIYREQHEVEIKVLTLAVVLEYPVRIHSQLHSPHCHLGFPVEI